MNKIVFVTNLRAKLKKKTSKRRDARQPRYGGPCNKNDKICESRDDDEDEE